MGISGVQRLVAQPKVSWRLPWYLRPGQMVMVETVALTGPEAVVRVTGQTFNARGDLPAAPATFWALVEAVTGETLYLRRVGQELTEELSSADLARILDLPPDKDTLNLLSELLRRKLPLDRRLITRLLAESRTFPEDKRDAFWAVRLYLENLDIQEDATKLRLATNYLLRQADLSAEELAAGQEILNSARALAPGADLLRFFTFAGSAVFGEAYLIERDGRTSESTLPVGIVVQVTGPRLGEMWLCLLETNSGYSLKILVGEEQVLAPVTAGVGELKEKLTHLGYQITQVTITHRQVRTVFEALDLPGAASYRPVDTVV